MCEHATSSLPPEPPVGRGRFGCAMWVRWVVANAVGELVGLGVASILALALATLVTSLGGSLSAMIVVLGMVIFGTFEGAVVGIAQSLVLRRIWSVIGVKSWVLATMLGAFIAWSLGAIPSSAIDFANGQSSSAEPAISPLFFYGLAAGFGALLGLILSLPQWFVLRRHLCRSGVWLPANSLAWSVGMPVIFFGASSVPDGAGFSIVVVMILVTVTAAGVLVGAIHGLALVWLSRLPENKLL
jgi:hypothetical protein